MPGEAPASHWLDTSGLRVSLFGLARRVRGDTELHHQMKVCANERDDGPWDREHVKDVEAGEGRATELGTPSEKVRQGMGLLVGSSR